MGGTTDSQSTAVLFVLIGWTKHYDGTEIVEGDHKFLTKHPKDNAEARAFICQDDGYYRCGAGNGSVREKSLDVVFVARAPEKKYRIVAIYRRARVSVADNWATADSRDVTTFRPGKRPECTWPKGQGMRRWSRRIDSKGTVHPTLLGHYLKISDSSNANDELADDADPELNAFEGAIRKRFLAHRKREARLREAKIAESLRQNDGKLTCEVPGCGFDFFATYGVIGYRYAVVHHLQPLASAPSKGKRNSTKDLAIVCANCHAMIHRGGECRSLEYLIRT